MNMKTYDCKLSLETLDASDSSGTFDGVAAVYGNVDLGDDVILPGAFTKTLAESGGKVPILYQHNSQFPIGLGTLTDAADGLHIKGELVLDVSKARESYALMKRGVMKGLSIGYRTVVSEYDHNAAVRYLKEVRLHEVSLVTFPMNPLALVSAVKLDDSMTLKELIEAAKISTKGVSGELIEQVKELLALATGQDAKPRNVRASRASVDAASKILKLLRGE